MPETSSNNKRIAKNTLFLYIRMALVLVVSLYTTRVIMEVLGIEDYGIYNIVSGFVTMFGFLNTSMSNGIQRFYNFALGRQNEYSVKDVYNTSILIQFILALLLLLILETVGRWYVNVKMVIPSDRLFAAQCIFQCSIVSLVIIVIQIPYSAAIMAYEKMNFYAYVSVFDVIAKLGIAYAINISPIDKLVFYGILNLLVSFICYLLYYSYAKYHFNHLKLDFKLRVNLFKPMLTFSGWNVFGSFAYVIKSQGLNLILNLFFGPIVNAARGISNMVMSAIQGFQSNVVIAFRPQLIQSYASGDVKRVERMFFSLSKVSFVLLAIISIPVIVEINYILKLWLGNNIPQYTTIFTILVLVNMVVSSLNTPISQVVHATGQMKNYQVITSLVICSMLPISWLFLKLGYSPTAVYWVSLIITLINQFICNLLLKRVFSYSLMYYLRKVILPCAIFTILVPILPYATTCILPSSFGRLLAVVAVTVLVSIVVTYYLILDSYEKESVVSFIKLRLKNGN